MGCTPDVGSGGDLGWGVHQTFVVGVIWGGVYTRQGSGGDLGWGVHQTPVVGVT